MLVATSVTTTLATTRVEHDTRKEQLIDETGRGGASRLGLGSVRDGRSDGSNARLGLVMLSAATCCLRTARARRTQMLSPKRPCQVDQRGLRSAFDGHNLPCETVAINFGGAPLL